MIRRLHNDDWGYETNCFVCEQTNPMGLRVEFGHDDVSDEVVADVNLSDTYSGAPTLVHGGVQLALLDEAMAWATIAIGGKWALTRSSTASFDAPMFVDTDHHISAVVESVAPEAINTSARILDPEGTVVTSATAVFVPVGDAVAIRLVDEPISDEHRRYLAD